jgi:hypothetical protein
MGVSFREGLKSGKAPGWRSNDVKKINDFSNADSF